MAYFQLEVCSFVSISFLSFYWIDFIVFSQPEACSSVSISFLPFCWIWDLCFLSAGGLSVSISLLPFCWIEFTAVFQLEACSSVSISFLPFCWIEFVAIFQLEAISSVSNSFLPFPSIESITNRNLPPAAVSYLTSKFSFGFFLSLEDYILTFDLGKRWCFPSTRSLFDREHFLSSILLSWVHCFLSNRSLFVCCLSARSLFVREHMFWVHNKSKPPTRRGFVFDVIRCRTQCP